MCLIDTNIFIELLLEQRKSEDVRKFFIKQDSTNIFLTDFTLHSIGIILVGLNKIDIFNKFLKDIINSKITILSLNLNEINGLSRTIQRCNLDFDDAYQYSTAKKYKLTLVSFDKDFDKTEIKRKEPKELANQTT